VASTMLTTFSMAIRRIAVIGTGCYRAPWICSFPTMWETATFMNSSQSDKNMRGFAD
jgi:hypothetical protein